MRMWILLALFGMTGCLRLPLIGDETAKPVPLAPLATAPPPITARFVNRDNAHEISQSLWEEIERDARGSTSWSAGPAPAKAD